MDIKKFFKTEFGGLKRFEAIGLLLVFAVIFVNAFFVKDSIVAVVSAVCGILYSTYAGKGKVFCYFFGLCGTFCYSYLSFVNGVYGNLVLYMCYYFPMQVAGIFEWRKHLKQETKEIIKKELTPVQKLKLGVFAIFACIVTIITIKYFHGSSPVFDGITTVFSVFGMYLTVKRCIEQWIMWMIVNSLSAIMWLNLILHGAKAYSTFIMWVVYFALAVYFYICWRKEISAKS